MRPLLLALALLCAATTAGAQALWRMPTEYPATAIPGEGVAHFADGVARRAGGRLVVQPSYDAALGIRSADVIAAVRDGRVEAGDAFAGALSGIDPVLALSSLPFVATSVADARRLADLARPLYERVLAGQGQRLLYLTPWPPTGLWSKTALAGPDDLRGLSIRTYDATSTAVMKRAGAQAFQISFADAQARVREGSVNAVLSSGDGGAGRRLWDLLPHFAEISYAVPLSVATVGTRAYEALDPDLRRAVDEAAAETEARQWSAVATRLDENYARMRENGVTIRTAIDPAVTTALKAAATDAVSEWRRTAGPAGTDVLDAFERQ